MIERGRNPGLKTDLKTGPAIGLKTGLKTKKGGEERHDMTKTTNLDRSGIT